MSAAVPLSEAVEILRRMISTPEAVRAIQSFDETTYGPLPFFLPWQETEAEVTLTIDGGVVEAVASIRVGDRFANAQMWDSGDNAEPLLELSDFEVERFELVLAAAVGRL